jgi:serine-type D-Ala-D-Ala carboxypeptidase/endopeptidase
VGWSSRTSSAAVGAVEEIFPAAGLMVAAAAVDWDDTALELSDGCPAGGRFEVGSVTKTMTATVLASLVVEGAVDLDCGVDRWLAAGRNGGITLRQLATHTSGLPRLAPNRRAGSDRRNPYAHFTAPLAEQGLQAARCKLGAGFLYSNFGYQLLGLALERATGRTYSALLHERVLVPLSMTSTRIGPGPDAFRMQGHSRGRSVPHWDFALPGPGGVEATIGDLGRYMRACLAPAETSICAALRLAQDPQLRIGDRREIGLGWITLDGRVLWHNGGTGGFSATVGVDPTVHRALAILVNAHGKRPGALDAVLLGALS